MKKYLLFLATAFVVYGAKAQSNNDREPFLTKSLSSDAVQSVEVKTQGGSISIAGGSTSDARVEVYVWGNNNTTLSKDEIQKRIDDDYELTVSVSNHKLTAIAKQKHNIRDWRKSISFSFRIYVPQNVSTDLSTSGGSIKLKNLNGNQKFETSGGSLEVVALSGKTIGSTSGGSIHVTDCHDDVDLSTSGGSIEAGNCDGNIRLETSGGSLHLQHLKGVIRAGTSGGSAEGNDISGELTIQTSGSSIRLTDLTCSLDASTSGSDIEVTMASLGKYIKISNSGGDIDLTMPQGQGVNLDLEGRKIRTSALANFSGSQDKEHMRGKLNGGGVPVTLDAGGGAVSLTMK
jgi:hypothetical protein